MLQQLGLEENSFLLEHLGVLNSGNGDSGSVSTKLCTYCRTHLLDYIPSKDKHNSAAVASDEDLKTVGKKCPAGVVGVMLDPQEKPDMEALDSEWTLHDSVISERVTERLREIVAQLVAAQGLSGEWVAPVVRLASAAARNVLPVSGDSRDIRKYVRIKIVPGGTIENSNYFSAFSFGRKNVMLKDMQSQFVEPRILLLNFPIDYLREARLVSIGDVDSQEEAHLRILVSKIAAIKPDVVFVGKMVSYMAAKFFLQERIAVFSNVKPSVMKALARYTGGVIIESVATLSTLAAMERQQRSDDFLGRCHTLSSVDYPIGRNIIKTIFFLEGSPRLGGTIILRGSLPPVLEEVKRVLRFAIFAAHSLSLEHALIAEEFLHKVESNSAKSDEDCVCKICTRASKATSAPSPTIISDGDGSGEKEQEPPILMYEICGKMPSRQYPVVSVSLTHECKVPNVIIRSPHKVLLTLSDFSLQNPNIPGYISLRRRRERDWVIEPFLVQDSQSGNNNNNNALEQERVTHVIWRGFDIAHSARDYQYILVLHALARRNGAKTQCIPYEILVFEFYGEKERCLGQFLEDCCFKTDKLCRAESCKEPMHLHERSFLHNDGRVDITIDDAASDTEAAAFLHDIGVPHDIFMGPASNGTTFHWRYCTLCHKASCAVPLSKESWNLSFGKFLEMLFYSAGSSFLDFCPHSAGNHIVCFLRGSLLARFTYTPLHIFTLVTPSLVKSYSVQAAAAPKGKVLSDLGDMVRKAVTEIFDDIVAMLHTVKQYSDTLFRLTSDDPEKDPHHLSAEIEKFKELFTDNLKANRELIEAEKEEFMKRLDGWDKCDILELGNIKWELHYTYKRWAKILQELIEPSQSKLQKKRFKDIRLSRSPSTMQQLKQQQQQQQQEKDISASPPSSAHPSITQLQQPQRPTSTFIDVPPSSEVANQSKSEVTESMVMASSEDLKGSRFPWVTKLASHFTKTSNPTEQGATAPRSTESMTLSIREPSAPSSLAPPRPKTLVFPGETPASRNPTLTAAPTITSLSSVSRSASLAIPQQTSMSVTISASPVRVSMCSSPISAASFDRTKVAFSTEASPMHKPSSNNVPVPSVPATTLSATPAATQPAAPTASTNVTGSSLNPALISHIIGDQGVFPALDLASFVKTLTTENTSSTAMLLASTGIIDDSDIGIISAFTDAPSSTASTGGSGGSSNNVSSSSSNSSSASKSQRIVSFPPPPAITSKYAHPVQENGEIYFETKNENGPNIVVYKNELSTIVAYALLNTKEMIELNKTRYGTIDSKSSPEPTTENTKPLSVPAAPVEKSNMLLKSNFSSAYPPPRSTARSSIILSSSSIQPASKIKPEEGQAEKGVSQSIANEDDIYQDYDDYDESEFDLYDELFNEGDEDDGDEEDEYDEDGDEDDDDDDPVETEDYDEKVVANSPLGPKPQVVSPQPLTQPPSQQSHDTINTQQQQQQQSVSGEILREQLLKDMRSGDKSEVKYSFTNQEKCKISGVIYYAKQFYSLRRLCWSGEKDDMHFIRSLSNCRGWNVSGGKSKSHFDKTWDDRFVLKEIPSIELDGFKDFATKYFNYLAEAFTNSISTQLAKIFGIYTVSINTPDMSKKYSFLVMENLHYEFSLMKVFDLKGALRNRFISDPSAVQLDGNLLRCKLFNYCTLLIFMLL